MPDRVPNPQQNHLLDAFPAAEQAKGLHRAGEFNRAHILAALDRKLPEPVICLDEKCKQLLRETRRPLPANPGAVAKEDYEYERAGTCNIFVAVEPRGPRRFTQVTARRTKVDFVAFVCRMLRRRAALRPRGSCLS
jgi:hypothetical protein